MTSVKKSEKQLDVEEVGPSTDDVKVEAVGHVGDPNIDVNAQPSDQPVEAAPVPEDSPEDPNTYPHPDHLFIPNLPSDLPPGC